METSKKIVFSGAQPTGSLTLGNYIGAVQNWKSLEQDYQCLYSIVDLHSLTIKQDPKLFRKTCLSFLAQYLACGLNPEKNILFFQSHVPQHSELAWILSCNTYMGELSRMTQFKDKSTKNNTNVNSGLFTYPVLMAADILLYQTNLVPVGEDQKQHLELSRDIAMRFNNSYGDTFVIPEVYTPKVGARIMSLQEPNSKMSKSDENTNSTIFLLDSDKDIIKKFKRAVTDNEGVIQYRDQQPGIKNLITIYSKLGDVSIDDVVDKYEGKGYGALKTDLGTLVAESLHPFKNKYQEYMANEDYLIDVYTKGAERATLIAQKTIRDVKNKIGLV